ncbi:MAG: hypothetical protein JKX75_05080 [Gammaproteobacteria bacterium]|nr:hypothetical protein [Gammaproteobacteria bacterium]
MKTIQSDKLIEEFVRGPLGCNCPAKVFEQIDIVDNPTEFEDFSANDLIKIGGILLVLTLKVDDWISIQPRLEAIFKRGIELRDTLKFNRFRLVVATEDAKKAAQSLEEHFTTFNAMDEKIHLHVVTPDQLP